MVSGSSFDHKVLRIGSLSFDRVRSSPMAISVKNGSAFIWFQSKICFPGLFSQITCQSFTRPVLCIPTYCLDMEKDLNPSCSSSFRPFTSVCGALIWANQRLRAIYLFTSYKVSPRKPRKPHHHPLLSLPSELIRLAKSRSLISFNNSKYVANSGPKV